MLVAVKGQPKYTVGSIAEIQVVTVHNGARYWACVYVGKDNNAFIAGPEADTLYGAYENLLRASSQLLWTLQKNGKIDSGFLRI